MADDGLRLREVTYYLWVIVSPILLTLGTIGNLLSIAVLTRRSLRSSSASVYLIALAIADIIVLLTGLLRQFLRVATGIDVRQLSSLGCKMNTWLSYTFLDTSVWLLMALTVERILSVFTPHKVKSYCTRMVSIVVPVIIVVIMMALNGHILYGYGDKKKQLKNKSITIHCSQVTDKYYTFSTVAWPWIDFSVYSLIPCVILTVGNSCIARRIVHRRRQLRKISAMEPTPDCAVGRITTANNGQSSTAVCKHDKTSSMTVILLVLNLVFLVTTFPACLNQIVPTPTRRTKREKAEQDLIYVVVTLIMYINNSSNFILYCVTGSRFRKELLTMFRNNRFWKLRKTIKNNQRQSRTIEINERNDLAKRHVFNTRSPIPTSETQGEQTYLSHLQNVESDVPGQTMDVKEPPVT